MFVKYFGFSKSANSLSKSYLGDRYLYVTTTKSTSSLRSIHSGVPKGSILGPFLFSMFTHNIVGCCTNLTIHLYADGAQFYLCTPPGLVQDLEACLNEGHYRICKWADINKLMLNSSKTQSICIHHTSFSKEDYPLIYMNNSK